MMKFACPSPMGKYAPTAQDDACLDCYAGDFTKVNSKATTCSACNPGTFSEDLTVNCTGKLGYQRHPHTTSHLLPPSPVRHPT